MNPKDNLISMADACQNFSLVIKKTEQNDYAIIMQDGEPKFIVSKFDSKILDENEKTAIVGNMILSEHIAAFKELAK